MVKRKKKILCCLCMSAVMSCVLTGCGVPDAAYVVTVAEESYNLETMEAAEILETTKKTDDSLTQEPIYVYVCGAVVNPGVVELPAGSRADDALRAAGGFSEDAQTDYVNLAAKVSDGEKLYIPDKQEAEALAFSESAAASGLVNINTADVALLCTLPGIGETRAQDIIAYREANGAFQSVEDIMQVSGIKTSTYEKLKDQITIN